LMPTAFGKVEGDLARLRKLMEALGEGYFNASWFTCQWHIDPIHEQEP
jgi:hypothetical protein